MSISFANMATGSTLTTQVLIDPEFRGVTINFYRIQVVVIAFEFLQLALSATRHVQLS